MKCLFSFVLGIVLVTYISLILYLQFKDKETEAQGCEMCCPQLQPGGGSIFVY